ncbi:MAG: hypothetical protein JWP87_5816 [Labilithrix sp.]|nr:hypothetical protein [Labilithrix sp.]
MGSRQVADIPTEKFPDGDPTAPRGEGLGPRELFGQAAVGSFVPYRTPSNPRQPRRLPLLDRIAVKTSCTSSWDEMVGDDTERFCCRCSKHVYDLMAMDADDAEAFLAAHVAEGGPLPCARIYRRPDGRVLTSECPTGASRRHLRRVSKALAAGIAGAALAAGIVDLATRPTLGPDDDAPAIDREPARMTRMGGSWFDDPDDHREKPGYDVNAALRSDESTRPEDIEEGSGPGRRRYVADDPDVGIVRGTTALVTDTLELTVNASSRRRRHPVF